MTIEHHALDIHFFDDEALSECWICSRPDQTEGVGILDAVLEVLKTRRLTAVSLRLFGDRAALSDASLFLQRHGSANICPPLLLVQEHRPGLQVQVYAVSAARAVPVYNGDSFIGFGYEDDDAAYTLLRLLPEDAAANPTEQTRCVFEKAHAVLAGNGSGFNNTIRTWLFAHDILSWYDQLNAARNRFFEQHDIYHQLVPASTGVGTANAHGTLLATQLLAVQPKNGNVRVAAVPSPLQCPALDYKSSFSRAVNVQTPRSAGLYVSGTASIDGAGKTAFVGDVAAQLDLTMQVVEAILNEAKMGWADTVSALAYFKHPRDFGLFDAYCQRRAIRLPHIKVHADVCRHDLLFEIEIETKTSLRSDSDNCNWKV